MCVLKINRRQSKGKWAGVISQTGRGKPAGKGDMEGNLAPGSGSCAKE